MSPDMSARIAERQAKAHGRPPDRANEAAAVLAGSAAADESKEKGSEMDDSASASFCGTSDVINESLNNQCEPARDDEFEVLATLMKPPLVALDSVTVLHSRGVPLNKHWTSDDNSNPAGFPLWFSVAEYPVGSILDLSQLLTKLEDDPHACVIRGKLRADWQQILDLNLATWDQERRNAALTRARAEARKAGMSEPESVSVAPLVQPGPRFVLRRKELFEDTPHHWFLDDVDGVEVPTDPHINPERAVKEFIEQLPPEFFAVSHHVQLSGSAGLKKNAGKLKAHIWFWLDRKWSSAQMKAWAVDVNNGRRPAPIDTGMCDEIQVHYCAGPTFAKGVADPIAKRSWYCDLSFIGEDEVPLRIGERAAAAVTPDRSQSKLVDPRTKPGVVGAVHRAFTVEDVIERIIPGQFEIVADPRVTWLGGSGAAEGAVISDDRMGICASHNTWPWGANRRANLFDLIRVFKFGNLDEGLEGLEAAIAEDQINQRPSHREMCKWASNQPEVKAELDRQAGSRDELEAARREQQIRENIAIGQGEFKVPVAEVVTLDQAIGRFVFLADGSRVADVHAPHFDLALSDWAGTYAASKHSMPKRRDGKPVLDGDGKPIMVDVPVTTLWKASAIRMTAIGRTFKAGGPLTLPDPNGKLSLNSWRAYNRAMVPSDADRRAAGLFVDHVKWLFGESAETFLHWLAHIEQCPGVLPHTAWLHIAKQYGLGRNWMCSVLSRVWAGKVAANVNLPELLNSGFNGQVSGKVLAYVDEIREGARDSHWAHAETLKSTINCETRLINPKYGRQSVEFNAARWLMLSNHDSAIPLDPLDRRFEVARCDDGPRPPDYYIALYNAINDQGFIAGVTEFLGRRDISAFNPGAKAKLTTAKMDVVRASTNPTMEWCQRLLDHWPSDLILSGDLQTVLAGDFHNDGLSAAHRRVLEQYSIKPIGRLIKIAQDKKYPDQKSPVRLSVLRNFERWASADNEAVRAEYDKVTVAKGIDEKRVPLTAREVLEHSELESDERGRG